MILNKAALMDAWGELLSQFDWDWFLTLTFRQEVGFWCADQRFRKLVRAIRKDAGHRIEFFRVTDRHKFRNVPHYHCFVGRVTAVRRMRYVDWWWRHYGSARIFKYDPNRGAKFYLAKYLVKPDSDFLMSRSIKKISIPDTIDEPNKGYPDAHLS